MNTYEFIKESSDRTDSYNDIPERDVILKELTLGFPKYVFRVNGRTALFDLNGYDKTGNLRILVEIERCNVRDKYTRPIRDTRTRRNTTIFERKAQNIISAQKQGLKIFVIWLNKGMTEYQIVDFTNIDLSKCPKHLINYTGEKKKWFELLSEKEKNNKRHYNRHLESQLNEEKNMKYLKVYK